jgi:hypothetical protein
VLAFNAVVLVVVGITDGAAVIGPCVMTLDPFVTVTTESVTTPDVDGVLTGTSPVVDRLITKAEHTPEPVQK